jgi:hypothetical protein
LKLRSRIILMLIFFLEKRVVMGVATQTTRESLSISKMSYLNISFQDINFPSNTSKSFIMTFLRQKREISQMFSSR